MGYLSILGQKKGQYTYKEYCVIKSEIEVVEALFMFSVDGEITEGFKLSDFPKINAPAIAFPYLRAYISNLTLQSGLEPVMLPSINFVTLAKEKEIEG